ncbi:FxSxx-COOH system tetratricopeptide repeat protein [Sphaerisporangium sp. B11E5]|uniref:FxSxx-COOH system tetratricopeptide repeat protein n=1 Tax=Sphaerisporangium sp. B11E5 TaxID=3153563 RepID=UPI00325DF946
MTDTTVGRDLFQIAHVAGNLTITQAEPRPPAEQIVEGDIPAQPPGFQLREELLQRLHAQVGAAGTAVVSAVTGTPGVGKTLLAASYAWACQQAGWPVVAWVAAESNDQITTGLAGLAHRLGLRALDDDATTAAGKAKAWLSARSAAGQVGLVVFDNATDVDQVAAWCPATGAVRVVITSRNRAFHQRYAPIEVDTFTPTQAARFLAERTGLEDPAEADALAKELGYLPLALAQAAALIARRRLNYTAYRRLLTAFWLSDYLPRVPHDPYPAGTAQAILLSVVQAEQALDGIGDLLRVLAVLSPVGVPVVLLTGGIDPGDSEVPVADLSAVTIVQESLATLADTSLISFSEDGSAVVMHRLIQRVIRERSAYDGDLPATIDQAIEVLEAFNNRIPGGAHTWSARTAVETLLEQTDALHTLTTTTGIPPRLLALRAWCGQYLTDLADLSRAIPLLIATLTERERVLGNDHLDTLTSRNNLAGAYLAAGDLGRAIPLFETTLTQYERALGNDHPDTLTSRNNLAYAYQAAGDLGRAIPLYETTLTQYERALGNDHPDTLTSRNNLAGAYQAAGDLRQAIPLYETTLSQRERALGNDHPDTLTSRNNLAYAYQVAGDLRRAIPLYETTLTQCEQVLGNDHPDTLASRDNLAYAYQVAGDLGRAIPLFETTLTQRERVLGNDHPHTLTSRYNLAGAYETTGDLGQAIPLFETTLTQYERVLGDDHPHTLTSRHSLAGAYLAAGDLGQAIPLYETTLTQCERALGDDHPHTLTSRNNLAYAYQRAGEQGRAIPLYETTLTRYERALGNDHPDTLASRDNLAYAYQVAGDLRRAIPLFETTLTQRERVLGNDHPDTLASRNNLASAYQAAGDLGQAIPLYEKTLTQCEQLLGNDHPITKTVRDNLHMTRT